MHTVCYTCVNRRLIEMMAFNQNFRMVNVPCPICDADKAFNIHHLNVNGKLMEIIEHMDN